MHNARRRWRSAPPEGSRRGTSTHAESRPDFSICSRLPSNLDPSRLRDHSISPSTMSATRGKVSATPEAGGAAWNTRGTRARGTQASRRAGRATATAGRPRCKRPSTDDARSPCGARGRAMARTLQDRRPAVWCGAPGPRLARCRATSSPSLTSLVPAFVLLPSPTLHVLPVTRHCLPPPSCSYDLAHHAPPRSPPSHASSEEQLSRVHELTPDRARALARLAPHQRPGPRAG
jgi:hypothetical protein